MTPLSPEFEADLPDGARWSHFRCEAVDAERLCAAADVEPCVAEALVAEGARPRFALMGDGFVFVLRGVNLNPGADPEDMISARVWAVPGRVVTVALRRVLAIADVQQALGSGSVADPSAFVAELAEAVEHRIYPVVDELDDGVDELQEQLLASGPDGLSRRLADLRRTVTLLRRHLAPQRDALTRMLREVPPWFGEGALSDLREVADRGSRHVEVLDSVRERASVVQDEIEHVVSVRMNRNLYVMSVIAAVFLPLSFVTGLLGVNVAGVPGTTDGAAFWLLVGGLVALTMLELWLLRRFRIV